LEPALRECELRAHLEDVGKSFHVERMAASILPAFRFQIVSEPDISAAMAYGI
jgi:hypothetical protein